MDVYVPDGDRIVHHTKVDFKKRIISKTVHVMQYDDRLPILAVSLYSGGDVYIVPEGADVNIRFGKKDHTFVYNPALGCDASRKIVYFDITNQMTTEYGEFAPIVEVILGSDIAGSGYISIDIDRNPIQNGDIESTTEYKTIAGYAEATEANANAAAASAEAAATSAYGAQQAASGIQESVETAEEAAQAALAAAEDVSGYMDNATAAAASALQSANNAAASASSAAGAYNDTVTVKNAAIIARDAAISAKNAAESSKTAAASSASAAAISESNAHASAQAASASESAAGGSAQAAASSASSALDSAQAAAGSAANAETYKGEANTAKLDAKAEKEAAQSAKADAILAKNAAVEARLAAEAAVDKTPYIGANGNWYEWNGATGGYVDTNISATGAAEAHASQHATGGSDPITPLSIGAASTTQLNNLSDKIGTVPAGYDDVIDYIDAVVEASEYDDTALAGRVTATEGAINTLNGSGSGSISKAVSDAIAAIVASAPASFDTLKEISDWISTHSSDAAAMNSSITALGNLIGTLPTGAASETIVGYIAEAIASNIASKADKVSSATSGNFAALNSSGNLTDSGKKTSDFVQTTRKVNGKALSSDITLSASDVGADASGTASSAVSTHNSDNNSHSSLFGNKADKVSSATAGNFASLDANGNLTDSGKKTSDFASASHTHDYVPTTRKVNNKALSGDITLSASDVGADASGTASSAVSTHNSDSGAHSTLFNNKLDKSGGTMTGYLTAVSNPTVGTGGVRNIYVSTSDPTSGQGANGDIWIKL